ncbi:MAG: radical SAM protein [Anaerolineae bacterium]|nr:radical SAM protein [Anaerolineae bacterium]
MKFLNDLLTKLYPPVKPIEPGIFSYRPEATGTFPYPMHLRIESEQDALLILNASTVLHLNQTAAEYLYHYIQGLTREEIIRRMGQRYRMSKEVIMTDFDDLFDRLTLLMETPDLDPVSFLDFERDTPHSSDLSAPYRIDLALTYRYGDDSSGDKHLNQRVKQDLTREQWIQVLDRAWQAGIPHVVFTGGEPTLCDFLPDLIAHAEANGQVTGLLTNGIRLADAAFARNLLEQGLDHIMIVLDPADERCWQAIHFVMPEDVYVTIHLTISRKDTTHYQQILERLIALDVQSLSLSAVSADLQETLAAVNEFAVYKGVTMVWDVPVPYSTMNPVTLEAEAEGQALDVNNLASLYVEPDGDVLDTQGATHVFGNLLKDDWETIWNNVTHPTS